MNLDDALLHFRSSMELCFKFASKTTVLIKKKKTSKTKILSVRAFKTMIFKVIIKYLSFNQLFFLSTEQ